jgi:hypothetical protein
MRTGDKVEIKHGDTTVDGLVVLASSNGKSLMLSFAAILNGHVGTMPVLQDDAGVYRSIVTGRGSLVAETVEADGRPPAVPVRLAGCGCPGR